MKQKFLKDGSVHADFNYKGKKYSVNFPSMKELEKFLSTL